MFPRIIKTKDSKMTCFKSGNQYTIFVHDHGDDAAVTDIYTSPVLPPEFLTAGELKKMKVKERKTAARAARVARRTAQAIATCAGLTPDVIYTNVDMAIEGHGAYKEFTAKRYNAAGYIVVHQGRKKDVFEIDANETCEAVLLRLSWIVDLDKAKVTTQYVEV